MPIMSALGVGSGLDLGNLLDQLSKGEQEKLTPFKQQKASYKTQLSAYGKLQGALDDLSSATKALDKTSLFKGVKLDSNSEAFTASSSSDAVPGHYQVDISQLARAQSLVTGDIGAKDETLGAGTITLTVGDGQSEEGEQPKTATINISSADSTLTGIRNAINEADIGVTASIIDDGEGDRYHLVLSSQETGTDNEITVQVDDDANAGKSLASVLSYDGDPNGNNGLSQTVAAQNAALNINGIDIHSQSNVVKDAIQGVTLSLTGTTPNGPDSLDSTRDTGSIKDAIKGFVKAYNSYHDTSDKLTAYNGDSQVNSDDDQKKANGILIGKSAPRRIANGLRQALNTPVEGSDKFTLRSMGISVELDGSLKIDSDKLDKAVDNHLGDVKTLLAGTDDTDGLAGIMTNTLDRMSGNNGLLSTVTDGIETSIDSVNDRMERMQKSINAQIERYRTQFQQLDQVMSDLNNTKSYLSSQLSALSNSNDNN